RSWPSLDPLAAPFHEPLADDLRHLIRGAGGDPGSGRGERDGAPRPGQQGGGERGIGLRASPDRSRIPAALEVAGVERPGPEGGVLYEVEEEGQARLHAADLQLAEGPS